MQNFLYHVSLVASGIVVHGQNIYFTLQRPVQLQLDVMGTADASVYTVAKTWQI